MMKTTMHKKVKKYRAFTLIEVMIALTILSISMMAGIVTTNSVLERTVYIERKMLAHWVGMNILHKLELKMFKEGLQVSSNNGTDKMRGIEFKWEYNIEKVEVDSQEMLDLEVIVSEESNRDGARSSSFLDKVSRKVKVINS